MLRGCCAAALLAAAVAAAAPVPLPPNVTAIAWPSKPAVPSLGLTMG
jgi:exopolysaccharide biosynthesis protein